MSRAPGFLTAGTRSRNTPRAVAAAWLLAGTLDLAVACTYYPLTSGLTVTRLLQGIARGLLGPEAFTGGMATAAFGVACHYLIALIWTLVFAVAVRKLRFLTRNRFWTGMGYGVVVWLVMNLAVLPLSRVGRAPLHLGPAIVGTIILMFCIGLPIAMILGKRSPAGTAEAR